MRRLAGRPARQAACALDSQAAKAPFAEVCGHAGGKRIVGRKCHVAADTDGRLLMVHLTPADVSDSNRAQTIVGAIRKRWPCLKQLYAEAGYDRTKLTDKATVLDLVVEIVRRSDKAAGFEVIPRRWIVERTFGWMIRWRRLVRDNEKRLDFSVAALDVAMGELLLRRTAQLYYAREALQKSKSSEGCHLRTTNNYVVVQNKIDSSSCGLQLFCIENIRLARRYVS